MAGVTPTGFVAKTFAELQTAIANELRARFGNEINLGPGSVFAAIRDLYALMLSELWDVANDIALSHTRSGAEGFWLDEIGRLVGVSRLPATRSQVDVDLTGSPGTLVPAGTRFRVAGTTREFELTADVTIDGGGAGTGVAVSVDYGPVEAVAGSLTEIVTPVSGLTAVNNPTDAVLGRNAETDAELRARIAESTAVIGGGTVEAILARLRNLTGVTAALVVENPTDTTDTDGRPPHSFEAVVEGGDETEIAETLWDAKPAGIQIVSTAPSPITKTVVDSQGVSRTIVFSRPTPVDIYVDVEVTQNPEEADIAPPDIATAVRDAILEAGRKHGIGDDVIVQRLLGAAVAVPGVGSVQMGVDTSPTTPTGPFSNIVIGPTQVSAWDSTRVSVTVI